MLRRVICRLGDLFLPDRHVAVVCRGPELAIGAVDLGEDFTALTLGGAWQKGRWSARVRGEYRDGETANRQGATAAAIRQLGEGSVVGSAMRWTKATGADGASSEIADAALSLAHRPAGSDFAFLSKVEYRSDRIAGATAGSAAPAGPSRLTIDGDARSSRLIGSVSGNWTPRDRAGRERGELGLFVGLRHNFDRFEGFDLADTTLLGGANLRVAVGEHVEIGGRATVRASLEDGATRFAIGVLATAICTVRVVPQGRELTVTVGRLVAVRVLTTLRAASRIPRWTSHCPILQRSRQRGGTTPQRLTMNHPAGTLHPASPHRHGCVAHRRGSRRYGHASRSTRARAASTAGRRGENRDGGDGRSSREKEPVARR